MIRKSDGVDYAEFLKVGYWRIKVSLCWSTATRITRIIPSMKRKAGVFLVLLHVIVFRFYVKWIAENKLVVKRLRTNGQENGTQKKTKKQTKVTDDGVGWGVRLILACRRQKERKKKRTRLFLLGLLGVLDGEAPDIKVIAEIVDHVDRKVSVGGSREGETAPQVNVLHV
jgi:hypothetical protein